MGVLQNLALRPLDCALWASPCRLGLEHSPQALNLTAVRRRTHLVELPVGSQGQLLEESGGGCRFVHLIGNSLVMRTRAATEGRPYTGSDVRAGLRARPISPNNRLFRQPPGGPPLHNSSMAHSRVRQSTEPRSLHWPPTRHTRHRLESTTHRLHPFDSGPKRLNTSDMFCRFVSGFASTSSETVTFGTTRRSVWKNASKSIVP